MEYTIKDIDNGWLITGIKDEDLLGDKEATLFVPTLNAITEILKIWQKDGFIPAVKKSLKLIATEI